MVFCLSVLSAAGLVFLPARAGAADLEKKAAAFQAEQTVDPAEVEDEDISRSLEEGLEALLKEKEEVRKNGQTVEKETEAPAGKEAEAPAGKEIETTAEKLAETTAGIESVPPSLEESELPSPADPGAYTKGKLIFIGDSRTVDIMNAVHDNSIWSCKVGKGYTWMSGTGVPNIEDEIEKNTSVIFLMGVNDPANLRHYITYINAKANEWAAIGAQTYFVSVGPVTADPYVTNEQIEVFNASMEASLAGVIYIDIYNFLMENGFSTIDGTHYPDGISISIYNYILEHLEPEGDGIWG